MPLDFQEGGNKAWMNSKKYAAIKEDLKKELDKNVPVSSVQE